MFPESMHVDRASIEDGRRTLLVCGILAAVLYVSMTLFVGLLWPCYSVASQTISELSAIDAPTRPLWMRLGVVYTLLMIAFGWIVWKSAPPSRALRVVGALLMTQAAFAFFWPPMHQRAALAADGRTLTDTLHIAWTIATGLFFMSALGFGAAALGKGFRVYSIVTMAIVFVCGAWTGTYASRIEANLPTPWAGVWERANSTAFMVWIGVLAIALLRRSKPSPDNRGGPGWGKLRPRFVISRAGALMSSTAHLHRSRGARSSKE